MKKILIVDDIDANLYLLQSLLEGHGFYVTQAKNGADAIVSALASPPDLIISDLLMPVIDGFTLCKICKADKRLFHIPFVVYTATFTDPMDEQLALDMGADIYIVKPAGPEDFINQINNLFITDIHRTSVTTSSQKKSNETILKSYNEVVVRKLEHKMRDLEAMNERLKAEIEKRETADRTLLESEERYRSLFENSIDGALLTEPNGTIIKANEAICRMLQRTEEEIVDIGRSGIVDTDDPRLAKAIEERRVTGRFFGELTMIRKDGSTFPCEISTSIFVDSVGKQKTSMIVRDISERRKNEKQMTELLNEKDTLLKEIHHRVKNNLQIVLSILSLQKGKTDSSDTRNALEEITGRIQAISAVHELVYQSENYKSIDFREYIYYFIDMLLSRRGLKGKIDVTANTNNLIFDLNMMIPLGMIINELVTNSTNHAFPDGEKGLIDILITRTGDEYLLVVSDNGKENEKPLAGNADNTIGLNILNGLVHQIKGDINYGKGNGNKVTIIFKEIQLTSYRNINNNNF
jgi:PAS domain S-box-containing protein